MTKKTVRTCSLAILAASLWTMGAYAAQDAKGLFTAKCGTCHGKDAKGNPAMAKMFKVDPGNLNLTGKDTQGKKDEDLVALISKGKDKMPAFKDKLKADEISGLVSFIRGLSASGQTAEKKHEETPKAAGK